MTTPTVLRNLFALAAVLSAASPVVFAAPSARLTGVAYTDGVLKVQLDGPSTWRTTQWRSANRFILDIDAVGGGKNLQALSVKAKRLVGVRWTQFKPDVVRVVLDMKQPHTPRVLSSQPSDAIEVRVEPIPTRLSGSRKAAAAQTGSDETVPAPAPTPRQSAPAPVAPDGGEEDAAPAPPDQPVAPATAARAAIGTLSVERDDEGRPKRVIVPIEGMFSTNASWQDLHLVLNVPGAAPGPEQIVPINDDVCLRARTAKEDGRACVMVDFTARVNYTVEPLEDESGVAIVLDLSTPVAEPEPVPNMGALSGRTIVVDAGHGGRDTGTRGPWVIEKNTNLDVALRLARVLTSQGAHVILTRKTDVLIPLRQRPAIAMEAGADAFVSLHCNYASANHRGVEVWHRRSDEDSRRLAAYLYRAELKATGFYGRGVKPESRAPEGGLAVLKHNTVPCALVEIGFVNDPVEGKSMASPEWREKLATALAGGLARFLERRN